MIWHFSRACQKQKMLVHTSHDSPIKILILQDGKVKQIDITFWNRTNNAFCGTDKLYFSNYNLSLDVRLQEIA